MAPHFRRRSHADVLPDVTVDGPSIFAGAEQLEVEGIVSKRIGSRYRSGRSDRWLKTKCFTETALVLIGTERKDKGPPAALLARRHEGEFVYAGKAMITLTSAEREKLGRFIERSRLERAPIAALRRTKAQWLKPELTVGVRHLRGSGGLRHATVRRITSR